MIVWVIAGLLGMATGLRIGWALVNQRSVVSSAMIIALGSLAVVAALNWVPLTLLVDTALGWPNIAIGLSQVALVASATGSCVMITSVASTRQPEVTRRRAVLQYGLGTLIAVLTMTLFLGGERQPEMAPREYLTRNLGSANTSLHWLVPLLYVLFILTLVAWVGMRLANPSRRGRALFIFTIGIALIVAAGAFLLMRAVGSTPLVGVGTAATLLMCAMAVVAVGSLLPAVEDWFGARRELHVIGPLRREMSRRHPDIGIGVRPRGPLAFRVAEQLSLISDALYLEAEAVRQTPDFAGSVDVQPATSASAQALAVAQWIRADGATGAFPGHGWLRQPANCSDREWILEIARQYRSAGRSSGSNTNGGAGRAPRPVTG